MARPASKHPTELELEILKVLWGAGPANVRAVRDALAQKGRDLAYNSVMTILNIMVDKEYLHKAKRDGSYHYEPHVSQSDTTGRMLGDLLDRAFDGSASALMLQLLDAADIQADELAELRRRIDEKAGGREQ